MGYTELTFKLPTDYTEAQLRKKISKKLRLENFTFQIENSSLDARNKRNIHWFVKVGVSSPALKTEAQPESPTLDIPYKKRHKKIVVVGAGPAGFFAAVVLQKAGFHTTLIERGTDVDKRADGIDLFEKSGVFNPISNYAFGEGGAGTFSDGKLTSRTKKISAEKDFILNSYVDAGAPKEILHMTHPHLGSDNLKIIVKNLRDQFIDLGGTIHFETQMTNIQIQNHQVKSIETDNGEILADALIVAPGHSAYETHKMLMEVGVPFRTKNFAIGCRVEHPQELINQSQWGCTTLPGVKAAEYRLTGKADNGLPVYTFCMCPGGIVVPATGYADTNIVNGMSLYQRNNEFANAACVAGINLSSLLNREVSPIESLEWLEKLEQQFYQFSQSHAAPFCTIDGFIHQKVPQTVTESSYPLGLTPAPLWEMLPDTVSHAITQGMIGFSKKLKGFETGNIMGLESKTSAPIQVLRDKSGLVDNFENLYVSGEGSGYAGGIISSAADGIKAALAIMEKMDT